MKLGDVLKAEVTFISPCFPLLFHLENNVKKRVVLVRFIPGLRVENVISLSMTRANVSFFEGQNATLGLLTESLAVVCCSCSCSCFFLFFLMFFNDIYSFDILRNSVKKYILFIMLYFCMSFMPIFCVGPTDTGMYVCEIARPRVKSSFG